VPAEPEADDCSQQSRSTTTSPRPKIAFVGVSGQGWRTYIDAITPICIQHPDFDAVFIDLPKEVSGIGASGVERLRRRGLVLRTVRRADARGYLRARHIRRRLAEVQPDWIHFFDHHLAHGPFSDSHRNPMPPFSVSTTGTATARLAELNSNPIRHRFGEVHHFLRRRTRREEPILRAAEFIACISSYARDTLPESAKPKAFLAPFCVSPSDAAAAVIERRTDPLDPVTITFIGADFARKGGERLLQWIRDGRFAPHTVEIVTFDPQPPETIGLAGLVWRGRADNHEVRAEILPRSAVLILPTWLDSSPVVLIEAAAAGVPAVVSRIRGIPDLVIDGVTGFTVDTNDDEAFIEAVIRLCADSELRESMSSKARDHYRLHFTPERAATPLLDRLSTAWSG
jgi:glycosyltransferase involved in cell wall biosynthesis